MNGRWGGGGASGAGRGKGREGSTGEQKHGRAGGGRAQAAWAYTQRGRECRGGRHRELKGWVQAECGVPQEGSENGSAGSGQGNEAATKDKKGRRREKAGGSPRHPAAARQEPTGVGVTAGAQAPERALPQPVNREGGSSKRFFPATGWAGEASDRAHRRAKQRGHCHEERPPASDKEGEREGSGGRVAVPPRRAAPERGPPRQPTAATVTTEAVEAVAAVAAVVHIKRRAGPCPPPPPSPLHNAGEMGEAIACLPRDVPHTGPVGSGTGVPPPTAWSPQGRASMQNKDGRAEEGGRRAGQEQGEGAPTRGLSLQARGRRGKASGWPADNSNARPHRDPNVA